MKQPKRNVLSGRRYGFDGMLWWNVYDTRREAGLTLQQSLDGYLDAEMLAKAGNGKVPHNTRAMAYFVKTIRLLNEHHIKPLIVIMPYQPRALGRVPLRGLGRQGAVAEELPLQAVRAPGLQGAQLPAASAPSAARRTGSTTARTSPRTNSRRLIRYCIAHAPSCFRLPTPPTPTPSPSPSSSASPAPLVPAPAYTPVPEDTSVPADFLE